VRAGVVLLLLATAVPLAAHPLAPSLLEVRQGDAGRADVDWRVPVLRRPGPAPTPVLPSRCRDATSRETTLDQAAISTRWTVDCGDTLGPGTRSASGTSIRRARSSGSCCATAVARSGWCFRTIRRSSFRRRRTAGRRWPPTCASASSTS
jgi:hypothetical protein